MSDAKMIRTALLCAALASALGAQNLIVNPDFDGDPATTDPWFLTPNAVLESETGPDLCPASSQISGPSALDSPRQIAGLFSNCVAVEEGEVLFFDGRLWASRALDRSILVRFFGNQNCIDLEISAVGGNEPGGADTWVTVAGSVVVPDTAVVGYLVPLILDQGDELDPPPFDYAFDRFYLGRSERLFTDTFEGGGTCRWSGVVGASD